MPDRSNRIDELSPRQREVLRLVAARLSSKEIGRRLNLSPATIDSHIAAAIQRLDVRSRREAALMMERFDLGRQDGGDTDPASYHHGGESLPKTSTVVSAIETFDIAGTPTRRPSTGGHWRNPRHWLSKTGGSPPRQGMANVLFRCFLDAVYTILFFAIMSTVAYGAHWVVKECEALAIDHVVVTILRVVSYLLVVFDAIGVSCAGWLLTFRFVRAIVRTDD